MFQTRRITTKAYEKDDIVVIRTTIQTQNEPGTHKGNPGSDFPIRMRVL